jgi:hypothetical protein
VTITLNDNLPVSGFDTNTGSGVVEGNNFGATRETGETNHAGKVGGTSVWFVWRATANGVATFRTRGSSFDTLLAVYTGTNVTNLTAVASDEDRAGFLTSEVSFTASNGVDYAIAIDGYSGAQGNIVIGWTNDTSVTTAPRILTQPRSQTVYLGDTASFTAAASATGSGLTYQWYFGCRPLAGATNATLTISNADFADVGNYFVRIVATSGGRIVDSDVVALQLSVGNQAIARDKLEDLALDGAGGGSLAGYHKGQRSSFVSVSVGSINSLKYDNDGYTTQQRENSPCAIIGGASAWVDLQPLTNGVFVVDTIGSRIDTVLAVYRYTNNLLYLSNNFVTCDDNSAPDGLRSVVRFDATNNAEYLIFVDGRDGTEGDITLNWRLATAPTGGGGTGASQSWVEGQTLTLTTSSNAPFLYFQWLFNGGVVRFATNQTFTIASVTVTNSGLYSVIVSNFAGMVTNTVANVAVTAPPHLDLLREISSGTLHFRLQSSNQSQVVEFNTNLSLPTAWLPIFTNTNGPLNYLDPATNQPLRFYRTRSFP